MLVTCAHSSQLRDKIYGSLPRELNTTDLLDYFLLGIRILLYLSKSITTPPSISKHYYQDLNRHSGDQQVVLLLELQYCYKGFEFEGVKYCQVYVSRQKNVRTSASMNVRVRSTAMPRASLLYIFGFFSSLYFSPRMDFLNVTDPDLIHSSTR